MHGGSGVLGVAEVAASGALPEQMAWSFSMEM